MVSSLALRAAMLYLAKEGILPQPDAINTAELRLGKVTFRPLRTNDGGYVRADVRGYQIMLDAAGSAQQLRRWSLLALKRDEIPASEITDKIVLFGVTAESVPDSFFVAPSPDRSQPLATRGLILHALIVSQLLRGAIDGQRPIVPISKWHEVMLVLFGSVLGATLGLWTRSATRFLWVLALMIVTIGGLCAAAFEVRRWVPIVHIGVALPLAMAGVTAARAGQERQQRALLMQLFRSHVSPEIAEVIWRERDRFLEQGQVCPQRLTATVLFCDICGFTALSERLDPATVQNWLNQYMGAMAHEVMRYGGVVDKYIGDYRRRSDGGVWCADSEDVSRGHQP